MLGNNLPMRYSSIVNLSLPSTSVDGWSKFSGQTSINNVLVNGILNFNVSEKFFPPPETKCTLESSEGISVLSKTERDMILRINDTVERELLT